MGHVGPTSKEKEKKNKMMKFKTNGMMEDGRERGNVGGEIFLFLLFKFFFFRFTEICPSEFVGINTKSALRDEGYA